MPTDAELLLNILGVGNLPTLYRLKTGRLEPTAPFQPSKLAYMYRSPTCSDAKRLVVGSK